MRKSTDLCPCGTRYCDPPSRWRTCAKPYLHEQSSKRSAVKVTDRGVLPQGAES